MLARFMTMNEKLPIEPYAARPREYGASVPVALPFDTWRRKKTQYGLSGDGARYTPMPPHPAAELRTVLMITHSKMLISFCGVEHVRCKCLPDVDHY